MKLIDLIEAHKGEITFVVKAVEDGETKIVARIDSDEGTGAIKDNVLNSEVSKYSVIVANKVPATANIEIILKEIVTESAESVEENASV